jgi:hypothetical protein
MEPKRASNKPVVLGMVVILALIITIIIAGRITDRMEEDVADYTAYPFPTAPVSLQPLVTEEISNEYKQKLDAANDCAAFDTAVDEVAASQAQENTDFNEFYSKHQGKWTQEDQKKLDNHDYATTYYNSVMLYAKPHGDRLNCQNTNAKIDFKG